MGGKGNSSPETRGVGPAEDGRGPEQTPRREAARAIAPESDGKVVDLRQVSQARGNAAQEPGKPQTALNDLIRAARRAQRLRRDEALHPEPSRPPRPLDPPSGTPPGRPDGAPVPDSRRTGADRQAFWDVWLEHREHLKRQSLRLMSGNRADAEDALSAAMLKASQKFDDYADSIVNERAWLTRLLHNACMDVYRGHKRQARWVPDATLGDEPFDPLPQIAAENERSPEEIAVGRETLQQLEEQIRALPPNLRLPFVMRFLQNRSYDEIAGRLELTNCAVRKRIQLARERLRSKIER